MVNLFLLVLLNSKHQISIINSSKVKNFFVPPLYIFLLTTESWTKVTHPTLPYLRDDEETLVTRGEGKILSWDFHNKSYHTRVWYYQTRNVNFHGVPITILTSEWLRLLTTVKSTTHHSPPPQTFFGETGKVVGGCPTTVLRTSTCPPEYHDSWCRFLVPSRPPNRVVVPS